MELPLYFISDIHLMLDRTDSEKTRQKKLFNFMDKIKNTGGTLIFVGDLFDFYFEYPDLIPKAYADFYSKALDLKKHNVELIFLVGNHDYWVQDYMMKDIMDKVYFGNVKFTLNKKKFYLTHGDGILSWDHGYRLLKKIVRNKFFIMLLKWIHPTITYKLAKFISRSGYHETHDKSLEEKIRNELIKFFGPRLKSDFDYVICGHYHLGEIINIGNGSLAVMGDWFNKPTYAYFDGNRLTMHPCNYDI